MKTEGGVRMRNSFKINKPKKNLINTCPHKPEDQSLICVKFALSAYELTRFMAPSWPLLVVGWRGDLRLDKAPKLGILLLSAINEIRIYEPGQLLLI